MSRKKPSVRFDVIVLIILLLVFAAFLVDLADKRQQSADAYIETMNGQPIPAPVQTGGHDLADEIVHHSVTVNDTEAYNPEIPLSREEQHQLLCACQEFSIHPGLALGVIRQETDFRNISGDHGRSQGYMQIQRRWWKDLMADIGATDLTVPEDNFRAGCAILNQLIGRYKGNIPAALTAYNAGRDTGDRTYATAVLAYASEYGGP